MSKPIKVTDDILKGLVREFIENISKTALLNGKISYTREMKWDIDDKAAIVFNPIAFSKMVSLVQGFDSEVAWHGTVVRDTDDEHKFIINDIFVYPQVVTGGTVNTDQDKYQEWLYKFGDDDFNNMKMQGHSHVNFATTPSAVDETHQDKILQQLEDDMFYIFMIWNKKLERTIRVYDFKNNIMYDNTDVSVYVGNEEIDPAAFCKDAKNSVTVKYVYEKKDAPYYYGQDYGKKYEAPGEQKEKKPAYADHAWNGAHPYGGYNQ